MIDRKLYPILKWAGGKEKELKYILPNLPRNFEDYYEPFVGGGAVYTAIDARCHYINDRSMELIDLYNIIKDGDRDEFLAILDSMARSWDHLAAIVDDNAEFFTTTYKEYTSNSLDDKLLDGCLRAFITEHADQFDSMLSAELCPDRDGFIREIEINLLRKVGRMKQIEQTKKPLPYEDILDNIETAFKSAYYMYIRRVYNNLTELGLGRAMRSAVFFFIRNFAYSGMFRYNAAGQFNVPYGGIGYNSKNLRKKIDYLRSDALKSYLSRTVIDSLDFEEFLERHAPTECDFVFLDPPYDSEFSTYAQNTFTHDDQRRLAAYLIGKCRARWMMIIKNTDFIYGLYEGHGLNIRTFDKTYLVSFMNRNDKRTEHLLITNY